jgi:hypothetical protein
MSTIDQFDCIYGDRQRFLLRLRIDNAAR